MNMGRSHKPVLTWGRGVQAWVWGAWGAASCILRGATPTPEAPGHLSP